MAATFRLSDLKHALELFLKITIFTPEIFNKRNGSSIDRKNAPKRTMLNIVYFQLSPFVVKFDKYSVGVRFRELISSSIFLQKRFCDSSSHFALLT